MWYDYDYAPVFGNFFRNSRNIISSYTIEDFEKLIGASISPYYEDGNNGNKLLKIYRSSYIIPNAVQENETTQLIPFSKHCDPKEVDSFDWRICLVAYYDANSYKGGGRTIENYKFTYEVCSVNELGLIQTEHFGYNTYNNYLAASYFPLDLKRDYKKPFKVPFRALPRLKDQYAYAPIALLNYNWKQATGIGSISGYRKDFQLRCIDIDGCVYDEFVDSLLEKIGLPLNYEWVIKTGSGEGYHIWVWCEDLPSELLVNGESKQIFEQSGVLLFHPREHYKYTYKVVEIRWDAFNLLPPSKSLSGAEYSFRNQLPKTGIIKIEPNKLFEALNIIGENTSIDYTTIIRHNGYWSDNEEVETIFMCLDVETDGLPLDYKEPFSNLDNWPHIVQLSYVLFNIVDGKIHRLAEQDFILSPNDSYSIPANMIHGITNETASIVGYRRQNVFKFLANQLEYVDYIIGHNISFDINVLRSEFEREKVNVEKQFDYIQLICTMKSAERLYPKGNPWPKLEKLYKDLTGEALAGAHNALSDVHATIECFDILRKRNLINVNTTIRWGDTFVLRSENSD